MAVKRVVYILESILVAAAVVAPMALKLLLGYGVRELGVVDEASMNKLNSLCFKVLMPCLLFKSIYYSDGISGAQPRLILFIVIGFGICFAASILLIHRLDPDPNSSVVLAHTFVRPNYILFGSAILENMYGDSGLALIGMLAMLIIPSVNTMGTILLELNRSGKASVTKLLRSIMTNPLVLAAVAAMLVELLNIRLPEFLMSFIKDVGGTATTMCFISMGAGLTLKSLRSDLKKVLSISAVKLILIPAVFLTAAVALGFRNQQLCVIMVIFGSPVAVATYPMAVSMGANGKLAGEMVACTTACSLFTIFILTFILHSAGLM